MFTETLRITGELSPVRSVTKSYDNWRLHATKTEQLTSGHAHNCCNKYFHPSLSHGLVVFTGPSEWRDTESGESYALFCEQSNNWIKDLFAVKVSTLYVTLVSTLMQWFCVLWGVGGVSVISLMKSTEINFYSPWNHWQSDLSVTCIWKD